MATDSVKQFKQLAAKARSGKLQGKELTRYNYLGTSKGFFDKYGGAPVGKTDTGPQDLSNDNPFGDSKTPFGGLLGIGASPEARRSIEKIKGDGALGDAMRQQGLNELAALKEADLNRPNTETAYGTQTWERDANGNLVQKQTLNPQEQKILDLKRDAGIAAGGKLSQAIAGYDPTLDADTAADTYYGMSVKRLTPQIEAEERAFESRMANTGVEVGSPRYNRLRSEFDRSKADRFSDLSDKSRLIGVSDAASLQEARLAGMNGLFGLVNPNVESLREVQPINVAAGDYQGSSLGRYAADKSASTAIAGINSNRSIAAADRASQERISANSIAQRQKELDQAKLDREEQQKAIGKSARNSTRDKIIGAVANAGMRAVGGGLFGG